MNRKSPIVMFTLALLLSCIGGTCATPTTRADVAATFSMATHNPNPPAATAKLIFVHHSCGENWLADGNGGLGIALRDNNYFVSDTYYGWGPDSIGDNTDIGHWWTWFVGPHRDTYTSALYAESGQQTYYSRLPTDPGGENQIIMFKSCYPNSNLGGNPNDPPTTGANPLRGRDYGSGHHTVANAKGIYNDLLTYFAARQDKLFVVITAPPVIDPDQAANARAFSTWLVNDWLDGYPHANVAVFDFYNILTSNGGNWSTNDLGRDTGNHHRYRNGAIQYITNQGGNTTAYPDGGSDDHPSSAGNQKGAQEFVPLLNIAYNRWGGGGGETTPTTQVTPPTATATASATATTRPAASNTPATGQHTIVLQQGVNPDPSYAGTTDTILAACDIEPNVNLGGLENLEAFYGEEECRRSIIRWDLSLLPQDITIVSARIELYRYDGEAESDMPIALYRLTRKWTEGTGYNFWPESGYSPDGATWTLAAPGTAWTTPGGDYDTSSDYGHGANGIVGQTTLPVSLQNGWISLEATAAVRAWIEQGVPNRGLLFHPQSGEYTYHYFCSRNHDTPNRRPKLVITYVVGGETTPMPTHTERPSPTVTSTSAPTQTTAQTPAQSRLLRLPLILKSHRRAPTPTATSRPSGGLDVSLTVANALDTPRTDEPVTSGVPIPRSLNLTDPSALRLLDGSGQPIPAQFTALARWGGAPGDNSKPIRWLLLDFQADVPAVGTAVYRLVDGGGALPTFPTLVVTDGAQAITINTGAAQFSLSKVDGNLSPPHLAAPLVGRATAPGGATYSTAGPVTVRVALDGPMRVSVHVQGSYRDAGGAALLDHTSRYWFYAGQPTVRLLHTVENNNLCPLVEYGQLDCYDIGSGGSVDVSDISLVLSTDLGGSLTYQAAGEGVPASGSLTDNLLLYQDSSGTDHWDTYPTLTDWESTPLDTRPRMQSYVSFRGYRTTLGATTVNSGHQAAGWMSIAGDNGSWAVGVRGYWQNFPKALRASPGGALEIGLFPDEFGPPDYGFNLRAGEHKTHEILLAHNSPVPPPGEGLGTGALFAQAPAQWYMDSDALGLTALPNWTDWPDHEQYVVYQLTTSPDHWSDDYFKNLPDAIESTDFYGIYDYGDWPTDYEGYEVAPLNCKYDNNYGMWLQWARGSDSRWFGLAVAANRHLADIDILHNLHSPRHWGDGIAFGHSYHDEDGFINPHRNYGGNHPDVAFGTTGMLLTYYLTGYEKAYESALELADCIEYRLHNDAHLCDQFPPGECSGEGYALAEGMYDAGCRPAANNLSIAVAAYRATADPRYLTVADALVNWARASVQPYIGGETGQDQMMRPWMLNMYLRALAGYVEMRDEFGLPDTHDAEGSFLAYANWLHTYAWIDLDPIDTAPRAAYPYEWWFDGRQGDPNDEWSIGNNVPSICNWLLLGADAMAYAHHLSGDANYLEWATRLFRTGSRDPWFVDDQNYYAESKETVNSITFGHIFLHEWAGQQ